jgi:ribosomal protein S18 acetylase RimI-like enzyme
VGASAELERIAEFLLEVDGAAAGALCGTAVGTAVVAAELPLVWRRVNVLRVEPGVGAAGLVVEEADRVLGAAGCPHRGAILPGDAPSALVGELERSGWVHDRHVVLVHRHGRLPGGGAAEEVRLEDLEPAIAAFRRGRPYGSEPDLVDQLTVLDRRYAERAGARYFAVLVDGDCASSCHLYSRGGIAEIHAVGTGERYRGRGLARAVVSRALEASAASGNELTFLQASEAERSQHLYRGLGFEDAGRFHELYRFGAGHPAAALYDRPA